MLNSVECRYFASSYGKSMKYEKEQKSASRWKSKSTATVATTPYENDAPSS
jgi:hypothetical protein